MYRNRVCESSHDILTDTFQYFFLRVLWISAQCQNERNWHLQTWIFKTKPPIQNEISIEDENLLKVYKGVWIATDKNLRKQKITPKTKGNYHKDQINKIWNSKSNYLHLTISVVDATCALYDHNSQTKSVQVWPQSLPR